MFKRLALTTGAALGVVVLAASPAMAHECFIVGMSEQSQAQNSKVWSELTLSGALQEFFGVGNPSCADAAQAYAAASGAATRFLIRNDKTIGEGSSNPNLANGTGLEHAEGSPVTQRAVGLALQFVAGNSGTGQVCNA